MEKVIFPTELDMVNRYLKEMLLWRFQRYTFPLQSSEILEIGIGNGRFGALFANQFKHYYGIDRDEEYVQMARANIPQGAAITYLNADAEALPFNKKFDIIFYANSWHFLNHEKALKEAERVLDDLGMIVIMEPSAETKRWADPRLREDAKEFEPESLRKKIDALERGREAIEQQRIFRIREHKQDGISTLRFSVLSNY